MISESGKNEKARTPKGSSESLKELEKPTSRDSSTIQMPDKLVAPDPSTIPIPVFEETFAPPKFDLDDVMLEELADLEIDAAPEPIAPEAKLIKEPYDEPESSYDFEKARKKAKK